MTLLRSSNTKQRDHTLQLVNRNSFCTCRWSFQTPITETPNTRGGRGERTGKHAPPTNPKYKHLTTNSWNIQALPLNTLQIQYSVLSTLPKNRCDLPLITNIHRQNQLTHFNTHISDSHQPMNTHKPPLCLQVHDLTADFIAFRVSKVTQFINKSAV